MRRVKKAGPRTYTRPGVSLTFLLCKYNASQHHGSTPKGTRPNFSRNTSGVWKNWLRAYKTSNISETVKDRVKVTINGLYKVVHGLSIAAKMYDLE